MAEVVLDANEGNRSPSQNSGRDLFESESYENPDNGPDSQVELLPVVGTDAETTESEVPVAQQPETADTEESPGESIHGTERTDGHGGGGSQEVDIDLTRHDTEEFPVLAEKRLQLQHARVKSLIKLDPCVHMVNLEATKLISRATEMFIRQLSTDSYSFTERSHRKTVNNRDVECVLESGAGNYAFLAGVF